MRDFVILRVVSMAAIPLILLYALYVQFHGDFGPGGGFQAGVIFGAGLVLYGIIFGLTTLRRVVPESVLDAGLALGVLLYGGTGMTSMLLGGNFLDYALLDAHDPAHGRHLGILLVELGVGISVTSAMTLIFYAFGGRNSLLRDSGGSE
jgi:multicomponent Na+:H+ antiporter subunit B